MQPSWRLVFWGVFILLLQWWVAPALSLKEVWPNFVMLFVLYLGLYWRPTAAMLSGFVLGLAQDTLCWAPLGLHALIYTIVAFLPHLFRARLFLSVLATQLVFVAAFSVAGDLIESFYYLTVGQEMAAGFLKRIGVHLMWSLLFYVVLFRRWIRWLPLDSGMSEG